MRSTAAPILALAPGEELVRRNITNTLNASLGSRLNEAVLDKVVRNTTSSWTQSGHLEGRVFKVRRKVESGPYSATFALLLAYLSGYRGVAMLDTPWTRLLDRSPAEVENLAVEAKKRSLIDVYAGGGIFDISFNALLTESERRLIHESH